MEKKDTMEQYYDKSDGLVEQSSVNRRRSTL